MIRKDNEYKPYYVKTLIFVKNKRFWLLILRHLKLKNGVYTDRKGVEYEQRLIREHSVRNRHKSIAIYRRYISETRKIAEMELLKSRERKAKKEEA